MFSKKILTVALFFSFFVIATLPQVLHSTTMVKFTERDLAVDADLILQGRVTNTWTEWGENGRYIYTFGTITVDRVIKGYVNEDEYTIKRPGGSIGSSTMEAYGTADFQVGDELILFLLDDPSLESNVLGWEQGRFNVSNGIVEQNGKTAEDFIAEIGSYILNEQ